MTMTKKADVVPRKSKAALTILVENNLDEIGGRLQVIRDEADSILASENPTKRQRKVLRDAANSLIALQKSTSDNIPDLVPAECSKYSINRLRSADKFKHRVISPDTSGLRIRCFEVAGVSFDLPQNRTQYSANEACAVLSEVELEKENFKGLSVRKVIDAMLNFRANQSATPSPLIPCKKSQMFCILSKYRINPDVTWPKRGRPCILSNSSFQSAIEKFERDENRAVSRTDMTNILKVAKEEDAKIKGNSTSMVCSPTKRSLNNYMGLLPQLDPNRSRVKKVQQKSEARYIAERSIRNAFSHILAVAVAHYQIGVQDPRLPKIEKATTGAKLLHKLVQKEFKNMPMRVILPMFISTTDDTTLFVFEGKYIYLMH